LDASEASESRSFHVIVRRWHVRHCGRVMHAGFAVRPESPSSGIFRAGSSEQSYAAVKATHDLLPS
jgi:hypothetical protein